MGASDKAMVRFVHPHAWLWEPLESDPTFVLRAMFGARAVYLAGRMVLCFSAKEEPWRGVLICTDQSQHVSLMAEFPTLRPHPILPKWLYLSESASGFEATAERLVRLVRSRDSRIGIEPARRARSPRRSAKTKRRADGP